MCFQVNLFINFSGLYNVSFDASKNTSKLPQASTGSFLSTSFRPRAFFSQRYELTRDTNLYLKSDMKRSIDRIKKGTLVYGYIGTKNPKLAKLTQQPFVGFVYSRWLKVCSSS